MIDTPPAFDDFDDSHYDEDDGFASAPAIDEPSSDDFLDEELDEQSKIADAEPESVHAVVDVSEHAESVTTAQNDTIVMDAATEDTLFDLDETPSVATAEVDAADIDFEEIAPLE